MPGESNRDSKLDAKINHDITIGWSVILIECSKYLPSFAFTIGLWKNYKHPEIISFGLSVETLHSILNIAGESVKNGKPPYQPGTVYADFFENGDAQFITVDKRNIKDYFGYAMWLNGGVDFPAIQLVWTDCNNQFPWQESYQEKFQYSQPLLDRNADFKFREAENLGIFTTRQWLEEKKPILRVIHDADGDWQFLTGDQAADDIRLVCLRDMIASDSTLNDLFSLEYGEEAERTDVNENWVRIFRTIA